MELPIRVKIIRERGKRIRLATTAYVCNNPNNHYHHCNIDGI